MTWSLLDTFSGLGGFSLAAEWTGRIRPVQFVERDAWCRRVLAKHWPGVPVASDIRDFAMFGRIDLITGGFPCQPFSVAGQQRGGSDSRYLWPELARIVRVLRPRWCLFENVAGIVNVADGLERVWADMEGAGYEVGAALIPAVAVGAPHKRERIWVVAHANDGQCHGTGGALRAVRDAADLGSTSVANAAPRGVRRGRAPGQAGQSACSGEDAAHPDADRQPQPDRTERQVGRRAGDSSGSATANARCQFREVPLAGRLPTEPVPGSDGATGGREAQPGLGLTDDGLSRWLDGRLAAGPLGAFGPEWETGVARVSQGGTHRREKLMALGNSIVPQVAYVIMLAMLEDEGLEAVLL